jgi:hypothetical protein
MKTQEVRVGRLCRVDDDEKRRSAEGQTRPFALVEPRTSFTLTSRPFAATIKSSHSGQPIARGYDIPNLPVLELARWLSARSKALLQPQRPRPILDFRE